MKVILKEAQIHYPFNLVGVRWYESHWTQANIHQQQRPFERKTELRQNHSSCGPLIVFIHVLIVTLFDT